MHYIELDSSLALLRLKDASPGGGGRIHFFLKHKTLLIAGNGAVVQCRVYVGIRSMTTTTLTLGIQYLHNIMQPKKQEAMVFNLAGIVEALICGSSYCYCAAALLFPPEASSGSLGREWDTLRTAYLWPRPLMMICIDAREGPLPSKKPGMVGTLPVN